MLQLLGGASKLITIVCAFKNIPGKSRDQNLKEATFVQIPDKIYSTLETLVLFNPYD